MQWEFSADEVVKGQVEYGIAEFRRDLYQEVSTNTLGWLNEEGARACFDVVYDYTYWLATGRAHDEFVVLPDAPVDLEFLAGIREPLTPNVEMLGAILQRMIMDGVENGMHVEAAVAAAAQRHTLSVGEPVSAARCG